MELPPGFELPVICERDDPRDAFVSNDFDTLNDLPQGARLGTSSLRRQSQMQALRPDLEIISLRGNVQTRLGRLDEGRFDAILLAAAGLRRLELTERIRSSIAPEQCLPAVGQGAVGIECREGDEKVKAILAPLNHTDTWDRVVAERAMNRHLEGGCQVPIAGYAELEGDTLWLRGLVASEDGKIVYTAEGRAPRQEAEALGVRIAEDLLSQGAGVILQEIYARA